MLSQHLHDAQGHVGGGHAGLQASGQSNVNDVGCEHVDRLTQHDGLGFDATNAPSEHAQTVAHGGV